LALQKAEPEISLADTNDLGINELIGFGETYYYHSIPSRIHNVKVTADKLNLTIVPPGEEFSFVKTIGPVNAETGYQQAYIIRSGSTLLEFGGGVCQVSTTTFRALLNAGLNITRRLPHSYRVSYYELNQQPGFDATVYAGNVDLRFINDTPGHILIYSEADSERLYMTVKIYGTDDGRTAEIKNYKKYGYTPPPEPEYIPTDSLPPGEVKQVENAVAGIKASFDWIVRDASGEIIREKTFYSNYQAWGAKYLVGE
jgi:vancomycin resistance protein YoaR